MWVPGPITSGSLDIALVAARAHPAQQSPQACLPQCESTSSHLWRQPREAWHFLSKWKNNNVDGKIYADVPGSVHCGQHMPKCPGGRYTATVASLLFRWWKWGCPSSHSWSTLRLPGGPRSGWAILLYLTSLECLTPDIVGSGEYVANPFRGEAWVLRGPSAAGCQGDRFCGIGPVWLAHSCPEMGLSTRENGYIPKDQSTIQWA